MLYYMPSAEENKNIIENLKSMSTFDLAYKLAMGEFTSEVERFNALLIIKDRDSNQQNNDVSIDANVITKKSVKPPMKGSKTEKIFNLFKEGKTPVEVYDVLTNQKVNVYHPEIYRVQRDYFPERVKKKD